MIVTHPPAHTASTGITVHRQVARFLLVGASAFVVDVITFNTAAYVLGMTPVWAKLLSSVLTMILAYAGNRYWTFDQSSTPHKMRQYVLFAVTNLIAAAATLACLWLSHTMLGFHTVIADNVSANIGGLALGTTFRFWSYRNWVFPVAPRTAS